MSKHPAFQLDWNLVRTFLAVVKGGSLAAGANILAITHPTAARHIAELERQLGMGLFTRTAKGLKLNEAGGRLERYARSMQDCAHAFTQQSERLRVEPLSVVRLSVAQMLADYIPGVIAQLLPQQQNNSVSIETIVTNDLVDLLQRDADIAVRHIRPSQGELICRRVGRLGLSLFASETYVARFGQIDKNQLGEHRFVDDLSKQNLVRGAAQQSVFIDDAQVVFKSDSVAALRAAVSAGLGVGAFPTQEGERHPQWVKLSAQPENELDIWLVARPEVKDNEQMREFFTKLGDALAQSFV